MVYLRQPYATEDKKHPEVVEYDIQNKEGKQKANHVYTAFFVQDVLVLVIRIGMLIICHNLNMQDVNVSLEAEAVAEMENHHKEEEHIHDAHHRELEVDKEEEEVRHQEK